MRARQGLSVPVACFTPSFQESLPSGASVSLAGAVDLLAFGPARLPIGLSDLAAQAARFRAGLALAHAGRAGKLTFLGQEATRHPSVPEAVQPSGPLREIGAGELYDTSLVIEGVPDWLGPTRFADGYPEVGHAADSVSFAGVKVLRDSFRRWLSELSGKTENKRGAKEQYPWQKLEQEAYRLMEENGDFSADDPGWNCPAKLVKSLQEFCMKRWRREPSDTTLRERLKPWLKAWRSSNAKSR
jgi:hypothetical protein